MKLPLLDKMVESNRSQRLPAPAANDWSGAAQRENSDDPLHELPGNLCRNQIHIVHRAARRWLPCQPACGSLPARKQGRAIQARAPCDRARSAANVRMRRRTPSRQRRLSRNRGASQATRRRTGACRRDQARLASDRRAGRPPGCLKRGRRRGGAGRPSCAGRFSPCRSSR